MRRFQFSIVLAVVLLGTLHANLASASAKWFHSTSGNIQCEVVSGDLRGSYAYCQTFSPSRSVKLKPNGVFTECAGVGCVGDGPVDAFTLAAEKSTTVGQFRCTAKSNGIRCVATRSGRGFLLGRRGVTAVS